MRTPPRGFRWFGLGLGLISSFITNWYSEEIFRQAKNHESSIPVMPGAYAALYTFGCLGLYFFVSGERGFYFVQKSEAGWNRKQKFLIATFVGIAIAAYAYFRWQLSKLGYE